MSRRRDHRPQARARSRKAVGASGPGAPPPAGDADVGRWIRSSLSYVPSVAHRYAGLGLPFEDLLAAGNLGLVEAALRYDPGRKVKFLTYADWWIRKSMLQAIVAQWGAVRLPRYRMDQLRVIRAARAEWRRRRRRDPDLDELAEITGIRVAVLGELLGAARHAVSLEEPVASGEGRTIEDLVADDAARSPHAILVRENEVGRVRSAVAQLDRRSRDVLRLRYGLDGHAPRTLREVGGALRISRERVRQIERRALKRLREFLTSADESAGNA